LSFAASNAWADNIYIHVPGVTGPVTQAPYVGDIEVLSYSQGFSNSNGSSPICSDTSIMKLIDVSSSFFARSVLDLSTTPFTATIYFANSSTFVADTTIKMSGVTVTSVQHSGSEGGGLLVESISMHATSLNVTFTSNGVSKSYMTSCS
jgi:type VI protein secretion system component Hcp